MKNHSSHLDFLQDTSEIMAALTGSRDLDGYLSRLVKMVAEHLDAQVCSIYLVDDASNDLVLRATLGLSADSIGKVRLRAGEGLVGAALKELRPICESCASKHPAFRFFPGIEEERYDAFLAVPILRGIEKVGVLVVQREKERHFTPEDVSTLRVITAQLAGSIEQARALMLADGYVGESSPPAEPLPTFFRCNPAAPGCAFGAVLQYDRRFSLDSDLSAFPAAASSMSARDAVISAIDMTESQLRRMQHELGERLPEAAAMIFEAHLMILRDRSFVDGMLDLADTSGDAAAAVAGICRAYMERFMRLSHDYLKEKARDVEDLGLRLLANLASEDGEDALPFLGRIVVAEDVLPSDMLKMALENVAAVVLSSGGVTSHVAILARSLGIPLVIAHNARISEIVRGTDVLVDADVGNIYVNPSDEVKDRYRQREKARSAAESAIDVKERTVTSDGEEIHLLANINLLSELELALKMKCGGIGLYRSEFPFLIRASLPDHVEQRAVYRKLIEGIQGLPVTIRTLDSGGDKMLSFFDDAGEENPALGLRSVRFTLKYPEIMESQLQAILEAAAGSRSDVSIMFPMVSSLDDFRKLKGLCLAFAEKVHPEHDISWPPPVGMMIELPAVVEILEALTAESDFFSVGTNDFVQYMLAVDRTNPRVDGYYCSHHPAVLRSLSRAFKILTAAGKPVSVCGEMAHDMRYVPFFIGCGVRRLSVDPHWLPRLQDGISTLTVQQCVEYADSLLEPDSIEEVAARLFVEEGAAPE